MMSHAAIVCREYGMPAVTGTGTASAEIVTGQWLRVDGNNGTVTIIEAPIGTPVHGHEHDLALAAAAAGQIDSSLEGSHA
jgi:pyruvate,water dikinase